MKPEESDPSDPPGTLCRTPGQCGGDEDRLVVKGAGLDELRDRPTIYVADAGGDRLGGEALENDTRGLHCHDASDAATCHGIDVAALLASLRGEVDDHRAHGLGGDLRGQIAENALGHSGQRYRGDRIGLDPMDRALVGEHPNRSGEDRCISTLELPSGQLDVLREMAGLGKPLVVVVFTGRPLELGPVMEIADAVVLAWHPGVEAGPAIADVIFGKAAPSGRLPITFPRTVGHIPSSSHERPTGRRLSREDDTRVGRYLDSLAFPELVFGFGLTYTTFEYSELTLSKGSLSARGGSVTVSVDVTNSGTWPGREVVQLYVRDLVADVTRPIVELADWSVVELKPGHTKRVIFEVNASMFGYYGQSMKWRVDPGEADVIVGPNSACGPRVRLELTK